MLPAFLDRQGLPYVVAATKADKLGRGALAQRLRALAAGDRRPRPRDVMAVSAQTKAGVPELWHAVREAAQKRRGEIKEGRADCPAHAIVSDGGPSMPETEQAAGSTTGGSAAGSPPAEGEERRGDEAAARWTSPP